MGINRIYAILSRLILIGKRDIHRLLDLIYWPTQDILLWGFTGFWVQSTMNSNLGFIILTNLVLWTYMVQLTKELSWTLVDELWSYNFSNLFASPIKLSEWTIASMIMGILKGIIVLLYCSIIVWFIFKFNILYQNLLFLSSALTLFTFYGWIIGLITASCIIYWGLKIQVLTWILGWITAPLCGLFYPIEVFPQWIQRICYFLPPTYLFKSFRDFIATGNLNKLYLLYGILLSIFYYILVFSLFHFAFNKSKKYGLARLEHHI